MRFYRVSIDNGKLLNLDTKQDIRHRRSPLNIAFEVKSYSQESGGADIVGYCRIYNCGLDLFYKCDKFIGKSFILEAGFDFSQPLIKACGYTQIRNQTIYRGIVANMIPDFSNRNPYIDIIFKPLEKPPNKEAKEQTGQYRIQIKTTDNIFLKIKSSIEKQTNLNVEAGDLSLKTKFYNGEQDLLIYANSLASLLSQIDRQLRIWSYQTLGTLYLCDKSLYNAIKYPVIKALKREELITQPEFVNIFNQIAITTRLRGDLNVGSKFSISGLLPKPDTSHAAYLGSGIKTNALFKSGVFTIISVSHLGEYANEGVEAWSTKILASRINGSLYETQGVEYED